MGLFEKIFGERPAPRNEGVFKTLTAYSPVFTSWGGELYESEMVRSAINARATHISKLSVVVNGAAQPRLQTRLRLAPNEFQTWGQFLYRLSTILDVENTAFIVPVRDRDEVVGIYPVLPTRCEIVSVKGEPWLRYQFSDGRVAAVAYADVGVMTKHQYHDDMFGDTNKALAPTMQLIDMNNQGINEGVKSAATFRFMARLNNFAKPEDIKKEQQRFTRENLQADAGGVLLFPNTYSDIQQIKSNPFVVDADQLKAISTNVYNYFGVNEDILQNKAFGDAWAAFYEGCVEPFAIQFADVLTKMLFTDRERASGSYIMATANRLQYMSNGDKLAVSAQMADRGLMTRNEIREIWNLPPLPEGIGDQLPVRGEYYNIGEGVDKDAGET